MDLLNALDSLDLHVRGKECVSKTARIPAESEFADTAEYNHIFLIGLNGSLNVSVYPQDLMHKLGSGNLMSEAGFPDLDADVRSNYLMNTSVMGFEDADVILLIGTNPRLEAPVFNAR